MRSLLLVVAAVAALVASGWYLVEWMPGEASAAASIAPAPGRSRPQEIRSLRLDGDRLPLTILGAKLTTHVGDTLDELALDVDRRALRDALIARGHWAAEVSAPEITFARDGGAHVSFKVVTGEVFHLRGVAIAGTSVAALRDALTLTAGDEVTPQRLARNAELLGAYLDRHGHPGCQVTVETTTDIGARAVDVEFVVRGPR